MGKLSNSVKTGLSIGVPIAALGVSTLNYRTNAKRHAADEKYQKKQLEAMNRLTDKLEGVTKSMDSFKMPEKVYYEPRPVPEKKKRSFFRFFSLRSGSSGDCDYILPRKSNNVKFEDTLTTDSLTSWLLEKAGDNVFGEEVSEYNSTDLIGELKNSDSAEIDSLRSDVTGKSYVIPRKIDSSEIRYTVNSDPRKEVVNLLYSSGILELFFVNPRSNEVSKIDRVLDQFCDRYEGAAYIATQPGHNMFHVEMKIPVGMENKIPLLLMKAGFTVNILLAGQN